MSLLALIFFVLLCSFSPAHAIFCHFTTAILLAAAAADVTIDPTSRNVVAGYHVSNSPCFPCLCLAALHAKASNARVSCLMKITCEVLGRVMIEKSGFITQLLHDN